MGRGAASFSPSLKSMGSLRAKPKRKEEQYEFVNDLTLRLALAGIADRYNSKIKKVIYKAYNDPVLLDLYRRWRNSGIYEKGGASKVHRKIIEFPNDFVYDFVDTVLSSKYGKDWITNNKALNDDLVRPWWVVHKL